MPAATEKSKITSVISSKTYLKILEVLSSCISQCIEKPFMPSEKKTTPKAAGFAAHTVFKSEMIYFTLQIVDHSEMAVF